MACPLCRQRKERRHCPALGQTICAVCCGTKRLVEIACPESCPYLASSREHPAAAVQRQEGADVALLLPTIQQLTERQYQLFFLFHTLITRHQPDGLARLTDDDVADAAGACAATLETSANGLIYEHSPGSIPAQRLAGEIKTLLAEMKEQGAVVYDREVALTLRAIEQGARDARIRQSAGESGEGESNDAYLQLLKRLLKVYRGTGPAPAPGGAEPSRLVLP